MSPGPPLVRISELRLDGLGKRTRRGWALKDVSLYVRPGELCAILGPAAAGKTTMLHLIAGLRRPDAGRVLVDDAPVDMVPAGKRGIAMVPPGGALWPHLTVFDNVAFGLRGQAVRGRELSSRVGRALELVGLAAVERARPTELDEGDAQRVGLARALAVQPRLLLLDDPMAGLSRRAGTRLRADVARIQRAVAVTTVCATRSDEDAFALATRVAVLAEGRLVQEGRPEDIYWRPSSRAVAEDVGAANLVPARVVEQRELGVVVETADGSLLPVPSLGRTWSVGDRGMLCLRPSALAVEEAEVSTGGLCGTVTSYAFEGGRQAYEVEVGGTSIRVEMPSSAALARGFRAGDRVRIQIAPETALLLPLDRGDPEPSP